MCNEHADTRVVVRDVHEGVFKIMDVFCAVCYWLNVCNKIYMRERSGSVIECLTRDRRAAGSSLTGFTALCFLSKTHLS